MRLLLLVTATCPFRMLVNVCVSVYNTRVQRCGGAGNPAFVGADVKSLPGQEVTSSRSRCCHSAGNDVSSAYLPHSCFRSCRVCSTTRQVVSMVTMTIFNFVLILSGVVAAAFAYNCPLPKFIKFRPVRKFSSQKVVIQKYKIGVGSFPVWGNLLQN